jgi:hypothetical protein
MASHFCDGIFYCDLCNHCSNLFGCIGLTHKEYCILNRQYSREEYLSMKERLIEQMKATGEWGEFFPASLSPFGYNETVAQEYFPLTQSEAEAAGFRWCERSAGATGPETGPELPEEIASAADAISQRTYRCTASGMPYKIILPELQFYRRQRIALPERAPDRRHRDRLALRNMRQLRHRPCSSCSREIETTYEPDCESKVYCAECYEEAIYGAG